MANLRDEGELDSLIEEFTDRFGRPVEPVQNLFFQIRVKLRGEKAGLSSVSVEGDQIVLRFPPLPEGVSSRDLPPINPQVRAGRNAYWMSLTAAGAEWTDKLLQVLSSIKING